MNDPKNIISANDLRSGLNVYFVQQENQHHWDTDSAKASLYDAEAVKPAFELACQDMDRNLVLDCLIVPLDSNHSPLSVREKIRAQGPSTRYGHAVTS